MTAPPMEELEALLAEAKPGPWFVDEDEMDPLEIYFRHPDGHRLSVLNDEWPADANNVELMALAPTVTRALIDARKALEAEREICDFVADLDLLSAELNGDGEIIHTLTTPHHTFSALAEVRRVARLYRDARQAKDRPHE